MELEVLHKGATHIVLYDAEDRELVSKYKWYIHPRGYAVASLTKKKHGRVALILMHRLFLGVTSSEVKTDHINHNKLDNRRCNIRACTHAENMKNRTATGRSKYLGVYYRSNKKQGRQTGPYIRACIRVNTKTIHLGGFPTEEDAARAYDEAARIHHGEFANLNFPEE